MKGFFSFTDSYHWNNTPIFLVFKKNVIKISYWVVFFAIAFRLYCNPQAPIYVKSNTIYCHAILSRNRNPTTIRSKNFKTILRRVFYLWLFEHTFFIEFVFYILMEWRRQSFHLNTNLIVQLCLGLFVPDTFFFFRLPSVVPIHFITRYIGM